MSDREPKPNPTATAAWLDKISNFATRQKGGFTAQHLRGRHGVCKLECPRCVGPIVILKEDMPNKEKDINPEDILVRELPTYRPLFWFELPEGPKREALRAEQERPTYKHFAR